MSLSFWNSHATFGKFILQTKSCSTCTAVYSKQKIMLNSSNEFTMLRTIFLQKKNLATFFIIIIFQFLLEMMIKMMMMAMAMMMMTARFQGRPMQECWRVTNGLEGSGKKSEFEFKRRNSCDLVLCLVQRGRKSQFTSCLQCSIFRHMNCLLSCVLAIEMVQLKKEIRELTN